MGGGQIAVIAIHGLLLLNEGNDRVFQPVCAPLGSFIPEKRDIRQEIDDPGNHNEETYAEQANAHCSFPEKGPLPCPVRPEALKDQVAEEQHSQTKSGIQSSPFGGNAQAKADSAGSQRQVNIPEGTVEKVLLEIECLK